MQSESAKAASVKADLICAMLDKVSSLKTMKRKIEAVMQKHPSITKNTTTEPMVREVRMLHHMRGTGQQLP